MLVSSVSYADNLYNWKVNKVLDGDTVSFKVDWLPQPLPPVISVRVDGVDTPEKGFRAQCPEEDVMAQKASKFTTQTVASATTVQVKLIGWDKYGGRVLGDVIVDGKSLSKMLIDGGYAREYHGEAKKSWCK